ncbi:MAG TPA: hypothetical protein VNU49_00965 [Opitutaceae bacterium]|jgi:hypothetical protein|nr:hypothetical protein [Opitutaceae bacterium]
MTKIVGIGLAGPFAEESRRDLQKDFFFSLQGEKLVLHLAAILL